MLFKTILVGKFFFTKMTDQTNQQNDEIDGLLLDLVKKGISWIEDYLHA